MDLVQRKALLALLAQSREHTDNAVETAPKTRGRAMVRVDESNDAVGWLKWVDTFNPPLFVVELRESNRLITAVLEQLVKDGVG